MSPEQFERLLEAITANNQKDAVDYVLGFIQVALFVVGFWYTIETRKLRKHGESQIELQRKQLLYSKFPPLDLSIMHTGAYAESNKESLNMSIEHFIEGKPRHADELRKLKPPDAGYYRCTVTNSSEVNAYDIWIIMYDCKKQAFFEAVEWITDLPPGTRKASTIFSLPFTFDIVADKIVKKTKVPRQVISKILEDRSQSFIITFYRNNEFSIYFTSRRFSGTNPVRELKQLQGVLRSTYYPEGIPIHEEPTETLTTRLSQ